MMNEKDLHKFDNIQKRFLEHLKTKLPKNVSFAEILSEDLNLSTDSAYRRIRGETHLTFEEIKTLCVKYDISLDGIFANSDNSVVFNYRAINTEDFSFDNYLQSITDNLITINKFEAKELIYAAKDIPLFYFYMFEKLASFKIFFWRKSILKQKELDNKNFEFGIIPDKTLKNSREVFLNYITIPSYEIWSDETINVTLKQIEFYYDCGAFNNHQDVIDICEDVSNLIEHLRKQAERGYKFDPLEESNKGPDNSYNFYYNEILILNNTVFFRMDNVGVTHLGHNVLNILTTTDKRFCDYTYSILKNILHNSTLISMAAEKVRNQFFNKMKRKVEKLKNKVLAAQK